MTDEPLRPEVVSYYHEIEERAMRMLDLAQAAIPGADTPVDDYSLRLGIHLGITATFGHVAENPPPKGGAA